MPLRTLVSTACHKPTKKIYFKILLNYNQSSLTFSLKVQNANRRFSFGVMTGHGERSTVLNHRLSRHRHTHYRSLLIRGVFNVGSRIFCDS